MERIIGEIFEFEDKKLQVKESASSGCDGCFFDEQRIPRSKYVAGYCFKFRADKKKVIFVEATEQNQTEQPQKLNLCEILKHCPEGTELWSDNYGKVQFLSIEDTFDKPIITSRTDGLAAAYTKEGWHRKDFPANCLLWPSRDCRDWSKFNAPWLKKERFDPKTLKAFDKVLCKNGLEMWRCDFFSSYMETCVCQNVCISGSYSYCIPYNDDTKHLVGTKDEAPEFYKYWED